MSLPYNQAKFIKKNLPKVAEPLDQLGRVVLVELDIREVHLQDGGAGVAHPEEHQLGLAQVHRSQRGVLSTLAKT